MGESIVHIAALHSLSGTMAFCESPLLAAEMVAVEEINRAGGVLGRTVKLIFEDGASDAERFGSIAEKFIHQYGPLSLFGCWTSASRKAVRPVVEKNSSLLWYPLQYEGLEQSDSIVYTGLLPNQQIEPFLKRATVGRKRFFYIGSDYVFPRVAGQFVKSILPSFEADLVEEIYIPLGSRDMGWIIRRLLDTKPDAIINGINGDSNVSFFRSLRQAGLEPETMPVFSLSLSEGELKLDPESMAGHFACWSYYASLDTPENRSFVEKMRHTVSGDVPLSDPVATAYSQIHLWKNAVEKTGSFDPSVLSKNLVGIEYNSGPLGPFRIHTNRHAVHIPLIAVASKEGDFQVVDDSPGAIEPEPWMGIERGSLPRENFIRAALEAYPETLHSAWQQRRSVEEFKEHIRKERQSEQDYLIQERKSSELGRMLGVIAHQWKQPLNSLALFIADIEDAFQFGELNQNYMTKFVKESREIILFLSDTIDDFSKYYLPSEKTERFSPAEAVQSTLRILLPRHGGSGTRFRFDLDSISKLEVVGRRNEFRQVILNLINNAREACLQRLETEPGIPERTIVIRGMSGDSWMEISVQDDGGGIPSGMKEHLFQPFQTTKKGSGSGLGLHLARSIIEDHMNGKISGENRDDGACFTIRLPIAA